MYAGDESDRSDDDVDRPEEGIPGAFVSAELEVATARFLADVRRIVRRRLELDEDDSA
jgi:hypothetical protein